MARGNRNERRRSCRNRGAAILGRNGKYQINNKTADYIWDQSILPLSYSIGTDIETFYLLDHVTLDILTDGSNNKLTWQ